MTTDIAIRQPSAIATERDVVDGWITVASDVSKLADYIAETDFVPKALRNRPAAIAACILTGRELGIGPMASLKSIHMVQGTPSLSAEYKRARALAAGHQIAIDESNSTRCVVRGRRSGSESWVTVAWTLDMAKRAKLTGKDVWQQYPQRMLQARATSELCDLLFPDATLGLPTTEELEDGGVAAAAAIASAAADETAPAAQPAAAPRTARRRTTPAAAVPDEQPASGPAAAAGPADSGLPPLPGEDDGPTDAADAGATASTAAPAPSQTAPPDETTYDTPGTATTPQITAIWTVLSNVYKFTKDEKDQARAVCAQVCGHPLDSTKDMSKNEAKAVLDTLGNWREIADRNDTAPREFLVGIMAEHAAAAPQDGDAGA